MVRERLDDALRPGQAGVRPDEDADGAGPDEAVDEVLRQRAIDLPRAYRRGLTAVAARVVDVDIEPVLVRDVPPPGGRLRWPIPTRAACGCAAA